MKLKLHDYQEVTKDFIIKNPYAAVILDMGMGKQLQPYQLLMN